MSCDEEEYYDDSDDNFMGSDSDSDEDLFVGEYSVLSSKDTRSRVDEHISEISTLLSVPAYAARVLLCKYGWNVSKVHEEWFSDEARTRKTSGLRILASDGTTDPEKGEFFCGICLESYDCNNNDDGEEDRSCVKAACGHVFCETCWKTYIHVSITDGPGSLSLMCPQPKCGVSIADLVDAMACDEDRARYENYVLRSFVESRKNIKWCPSPGCEFSIECLSASLNFDVNCKCSYGFCWNCVEEIHKPADCNLVGKWVLKNNSEAENTKWLLSNTKSCPKCHKSIEKNQGCMHMTCMPPCKYEFCWLCLEPWSKHDEKTGGYYVCNKYKEEKEKGMFDEEEMVREMAKTHLVKYTHYFERWIGNHSSRAKVMESLKLSSNEHIQKLGGMHRMTESELQFIIDAWNQILEGRRVLKWSYAIGYYLSEDEPAKKTFFEYLQGEAESYLERLHGLVEKGLAKHVEEAKLKLESDENDFETDRFNLDNVFKHTREAAHLSEFNSFGADVKNLTRVTQTYFDKLVTAIANGLEAEFSGMNIE